MSFLVSHWLGKLPLRTTLWLNLVALLIVISYAELFLLSKLAANPTQLISMTLVSLFFTRLVIFPWQLIGLLRAIEFDYIEHKNIFKTRALQIFALLTILFTLVYCLEVIQGTLYYLKQVESYSRPGDKVAYQLTLSEDQQRLSIRGDLDIGVTTAVRSTIEEHPQIRSVVLQSRGGQIYEGRGLANVFTEYEIDTYVFEECSSACATAFIGGKRRYIGTQGKLGFHQYRVETTSTSQFVHFYNLHAEQQRDLALFKARGIDQVFLDRVFDQPAHRIWFPDHSTLREAKIVHDVIAR
ncbi:MAG: hypothetical protein LJE92_07250 [Gammaproteobacteria bacterium]|jgi:hypothetical protein|nr:hypothetical protein [Gammaproteobacteria bacterium]